MNIKKIIAIIMACVLSMFVFVGCDNADKKTEENKDAAVDTKSAEEDARAVAEDFAEGYTTLEYDNVKEYVGDDELDAKLKETFGEFDTMGSELASEMTREFSSKLGGFTISDDVMQKCVDRIIGMVAANTKIEIGKGKVNEKGTGVVFEAEITMPDMENNELVEPEMSEAELEQLLIDAFGFDINDQQKMLDEWCKKEGVSSAAELAGKYSSQEDMIKGMLTAFTTEFEAFIVACIDKYVEANKNIPTITEKGKISLSKIDGEWKVVELD